MANKVRHQCLICGETRGIQWCHIIPRYFDVLMQYTPQIDYLVFNQLPLCPSHHWYFDHNLLTDQEFEEIKPNITRAIKVFRQAIRNWEFVKENTLNEGKKKFIERMLNIDRNFILNRVYPKMYENLKIEPEDLIIERDK